MYQPREFEQLSSKLIQLPFENESARKLARIIVGNATEIVFVTSRRVTLPAPLLEYAGIKSGGDDAEQLVEFARAHAFKSTPILLKNSSLVFVKVEYRKFLKS